MGEGTQLYYCRQPSLQWKERTGGAPEVGATGEKIRRQERTVRQDGYCQGLNRWPLLLTEGLRQSALGVC